MDVPVWPWNRYMHRCSNCAFLITAMYDTPLCASRAYDLGGEETEQRRQDPRWETAREDPSPAAEAEREIIWLAAHTRVLNRTRRCEYWTKVYPGLTTEAVV